MVAYEYWKFNKWFNKPHAGRGSSDLLIGKLRKATDGLEDQLRGLEMERACRN